MPAFFAPLLAKAGAAVQGASAGAASVGGTYGAAASKVAGVIGSPATGTAAAAGRGASFTAGKFGAQMLNTAEYVNDATGGALGRANEAMGGTNNGTYNRGRVDSSDDRKPSSGPIIEATSSVGASPLTEQAVQY